ncbi:MAG: hypothetical protein M3312_01375 [Actinomycetota bacterium]|nr:hypothetical protein [Actinomycetota bacterium]
MDRTEHDVEAPLEADGAGGASPRPTGSDEDVSARLLAPEETASFHSRWEEIQAGFVDEPRSAVEQADGLVAEVMDGVAANFSDARAALEAQWDRGDEVSTEDLRVALTRYRSFFERLLSA